MISLSCFACTKGLHRVVESAVNRDTGNFHSACQGWQADGQPSLFDFCTLLHVFEH